MLYHMDYKEDIYFNIPLELMVSAGRLECLFNPSTVWHSARRARFVAKSPGCPLHFLCNPGQVSELHFPLVFPFYKDECATLWEFIRL